MKIRFRAQYDRKTFFKGVRLANAPRRGGRITFWLSLGAFFGLGGAAIRSWMLEPGMTSVGVYLLLMLILLAFIGQYVLTPWLAARKLWANPRVQRPFEGWADARGLTYTLPEGQRTFSWSDFIRLRQAPGMLALVTRQGLMLLFTPQFFSSQARWDAFLRLVRGKVVSVQ